MTTIALQCTGSSGSPELEEKLASILEEYFELWKKKQKAYGTGNIAAFGAHGCVIRLNDKQQRLQRFYFKGVDVNLSDESVEDTWLDMIGYAAMGLMTARGLWPDK